MLSPHRLLNASHNHHKHGKNSQDSSRAALTHVPAELRKAQTLLALPGDFEPASANRSSPSTPLRRYDATTGGAERDGRRQVGRESEEDG